jgi:hypothetical protein
MPEEACRGLRSKVAELRHGFDEFWGGILSPDGGRNDPLSAPRGWMGMLVFPDEKRIG